MIIIMITMMMTVIMMLMNKTLTMLTSSVLMIPSRGSSRTGRKDVTCSQRHGWWEVK